MTNGSLEVTPFSNGLAFHACLFAILRFYRMIDVVVSIVNHSHRDLLGPCLDSVLEGTHRIMAKVVVLDNASSDGSVDFVMNQYPMIHLMANKCQRGFGSNQNEILIATRGTARYYLLLNDDTVVVNPTIETLFQFMEKNRRAGIVGARLVYPDGSPQASFGAFPSVLSQIGQMWRMADMLPKSRRKWIKPLLSSLGALLPKTIRSYLSNWNIEGNAPLRVDWVSGACMLVRSEIIHEIGLFDAANFVMFFEDVDWCKRAQSAGWEVWFHPGTCVRHVGAASKNFCRLSHIAESRLKYFKKHGSRFELLATRFNLVLYAFLKMLWLWLRWSLRLCKAECFGESRRLYWNLMRIGLHSTD